MNPLFSIWISPIKTFEYLKTRDNEDNRDMINVLSVLIGIGMGIPYLKKS